MWASRSQRARRGSPRPAGCCRSGVASAAADPGGAARAGRHAAVRRGPVRRDVPAAARGRGPAGRAARRRARRGRPRPAAASRGRRSAPSRSSCRRTRRRSPTLEQTWRHRSTASHHRPTRTSSSDSPRRRHLDRHRADDRPQAPRAVPRHHGLLRFSTAPTRRGEAVRVRHPRARDRPRCGGGVVGAAGHLFTNLFATGARTGRRASTTQRTVTCAGRTRHPPARGCSRGWRRPGSPAPDRCGSGAATAPRVDVGAHRWLRRTPRRRGSPCCPAGPTATGQPLGRRHPVGGITRDCVRVALVDVEEHVTRAAAAARRRGLGAAHPAGGRPGPGLDRDAGRARDARRPTRRCCSPPRTPRWRACWSARGPGSSRCWHPCSTGRPAHSQHRRCRRSHRRRSQR